MGADWVCLFDKGLCDQILGLDSDQMSEFLESHLGELPEFSELRCEFADDVPPVDRLRKLGELGRATSELKAELVEHLCVSKQSIILDYWACYAEVFSCDPPSSVPDYKIFPHIKEQRYLLLLPQHVDQMLASLDAHADEVTVMRPEVISLLRAWRSLCAKNLGNMVVYFYDY
jgi:hypothetical protein